VIQCVQGVGGQCVGISVARRNITRRNVIYSRRTRLCLTLTILMTTTGCTQLTALAVLRVLLCKKNNPPGWRKVEKLMDHWEERANDSQVSEGVRRMWEFFYKMCDLTWVSLGDVQHVFGVLKTNSVSLITCQGRCLYPTVSLLSHSCIPNLEPVAMPGTRITLRARTLIKAGEQLTIRYIRTMQARWAIQDKLEQEWFFICDCKRCKDVTELGSHFSSLQCVGGSFLTRLVICMSLYALTVESVRTCLRNLNRLKK